MMYICACMCRSEFHHVDGNPTPKEGRGLTKVPLGAEGSRAGASGGVMGTF